MKKVTGFLASDGTFFTAAPDARLYDAEQALRNVCESHKIDADRLISFTTEAEQAILEFLNARAARKDRANDEHGPVSTQQLKA